MDNQQEYELSPIEMGITLISTIFGIGILLVPRSLASKVGTTDGWISIIFAGILAMLFIILYTKLQTQFPGQTFLEFLANGKTGKWAAKLIGIYFILYFVLLLGVQARLLAIAVKMYLIDQTPSEIIIAIILLLITYAVSKGVQGIIHIHLMFTPFIFSAIFFLLI